MNSTSVESLRRQQTITPRLLKPSEFTDFSKLPTHVASGCSFSCLHWMNLIPNQLVLFQSIAHTFPDYFFYVPARNVQVWTFLTVCTHIYSWYFDLLLFLFNQSISVIELLLLSFSPFNHIFYGNRAQTYTKLRRHDEALSDGRRAITLKPDYCKVGRIHRCTWASRKSSIVLMSVFFN